jgi:type 1 glutamine amidotransferase
LVATVSLVALCAGPGAAGAPLRLLLISGSGEYKSDEFFAELAPQLEANYNVKCSIYDGRDGKQGYPGLSALDDADVMVVFCKRWQLPDEARARAQKWCQQGKPVVGLRTASHAFQTWLEFDKKIMGGDYSGHYGWEDGIEVSIADGGRDHPILKGVGPWTRRGKLYRNPNLQPDVTLLLIAKSPSGKTEPVAWARVYDQNSGGRSFYTSMGMPSDLESDDFRTMLVNAIFWTAGRDVQKKQ